MTVRVQGIGLVAPLGRDCGAVWDGIKHGAAAPAGRLGNPFNGRSFPIHSIDPALVADAAQLPRLRRAGAISHFAVAAALDAMSAADCESSRGRLALVFTATNGGVTYTRRFYEEVSRTGTHAGSPLLFPETVYNAPASHIAATLGIDGTVTTLVGDATAGVDAILAARELIESGVCDRCLVVAAEETDWIVCEAYATWRLAAAEPPVLPFGGGGAIFGEGAAALLLESGGDGPVVERIFPGATFRNAAEARVWFAERDDGAQILISSASGTIFDEAERDLCPGAIRFTPKAALGEAFAASTVTQVACACFALKEQPPGSRAFVPATGFQGQVAALTLRG